MYAKSMFLNHYFKTNSVVFIMQ